MDAACYEILADTGLAINDDADVGPGQLGDRGAQPLGRRRRADDARAQRLLADDAPQPAILDDQLALLAGSPHDLEKALGRERLLDEVVGAETHRLDRGLDVTVSRNDNHRQLRIDLLRPAQQLHPVHSLHLQVGDEDAGKVGAQAC